MSFVFAALVALGSIFFALFWGYAESIATAPKYDNVPTVIFFGGLALAAVIASSHWWPHIGW